MNKINCLRFYGIFGILLVMPFFLCGCGAAMMQRNNQVLQSVPIGQEKEDVVKQLEFGTDEIACYVIAKGDFGEVEACDCPLSVLNTGWPSLDPSKNGEIFYLNNLFFHNGIYLGWGRRDTFLKTFYANLNNTQDTAQESKISGEQSQKVDTANDREVHSEENKLLKIKDMHEKGLITKEEYDRKRKEVLDAM
jgi:hypothetical protein